MQIFFPKEASRNKKIVFVFIYLMLLLNCVHIVFPYILIDPILISYLAKISTIISLLIILFIFKSMNNENTFLSKKWKAKGERPASLKVASFLLVPLLIYPSISVGLPSVLHVLVSKPAETVVTVRKESQSYVKGIYVEGHTYIFNDRVYGIEKIDWASLKPGDRVRLFGKKSCFGFSYSRYVILR